MPTIAPRALTKGRSVPSGFLAYPRVAGGKREGREGSEIDRGEAASFQQRDRQGKRGRGGGEERKKEVRLRSLRRVSADVGGVAREGKGRLVVG